MEKSITKKNIIEQIYLHCKKNNNYVFDNDLVKHVVKSSGSNTNPYDMTKLDDTSKFPDILIKDDYFVAHIGEGKHKFVKGISSAFHTLEPINEDEIIQFPYRPSLLNDYSTSESSVLSLCNNHRIIHDFLYSDMLVNPNVLFRQKNLRVSYNSQIASEIAFSKDIRVNIPLIAEHHGHVVLFKSKKNRQEKWINDFNIFDLYNPFRYFYNQTKEKRNSIKKIHSCFIIQKQKENMFCIRLYLYGFSNPFDFSSMRLLKKREYSLHKRVFDKIT